MILSRLYQAYAAASPAKKLLGWLALLLALALPAALFWRQGQQPAYRVLFAELSDKDGGEVVGALERLSIAYRISDVGGAIEVPRNQWQIARYKLAAQGLPRGDKPADDAAGPRFGLSPFQEQIGYQRSLEGELAGSVESLAGIASARVHLALPKQSAFLREPVPPAATVLVKLKPGMQLSGGQVEAVRRIVVGGVPGMTPEQVSVVDQRGSLLENGEAVSPAEAQPPAPALQAPPALPAKPARARPARPAFDSELLPVYAGLAAALVFAVLLLRLRARQRRQREQEEAQDQAEAQQPGKLDARLDALRQSVLADSRLAAGVVKLWMANRAGMEKAAMLLLALGEEAAAQVLRYLSPFEVSELGRVMREAGALPRSRVEAVLDDYAAEAERQTGIGADADEFLDAALSRALGDERGHMLLERIAGSGGSVQQLAWKDPAEVAALLKDEHPQLVAAVLSQLDRGHAAATLEWLPEAARQEVVRRLAEWHGAPTEVLRELDEWAARHLGAEAAEREEGAGLVADLLARMSPAAREEVESGLSASSPELLDQVKAHQLGLQDLARLTGESRMLFFKAVPGHTLLLALKGADPDLVDDLLAHMPETAARRLKDDLETLGAVKLADIESAQAETVRLLREMAAAAQLELTQPEAQA